MNKLAIGAILGIAIAVGFSPSPPMVKIVIGLVGAVGCGSNLVAQNSIDERKKRFEQLQTVDLDKREALVKVKESEIESALIALEASENQLEAIKRKQQFELDIERQAFNQRLSAQQDEMLLEIDRLERQSKYNLEQELEEIKRCKLEAIADLEKQIKDLEKVRLEAISSLEVEREEKLNQLRKEIETEKESLAEELQKVEDELVEEFTEKQNQMLSELAELKQQLEQESKAKFESWLVPHCQEMDRRLREIEALKATVLDLREQIAESRDILLCREAGTAHGDRSNAVLIWLKQQGQYCDYQSSSILPDGTFVLNFLPWEVGNKSVRSIKGLLYALQVKFGLSDPPLLQPNGEARAWTLTLHPARNRAIALTDFYTQLIPETRLGETFQDIEPAIRNGVARQLNYDEQFREMMSFTPPVPLPRPRSFQITELELQCCRWFFSFRGLATDGREPNVTTREGLLYHIYGIREGRGSATYDPLMCESLGQRVRRILEILKVEAVEIGESEDE